MLAAVILKAETATAHRRAESALDAEAIRSATYSMAAYRQLIRANHTTWSAAANWLDAQYDQASVQGDRKFIGRQLEALELDLALLGVEPPPSRSLSISGAGLGELLGLLYVLRGSTLGGAMIARSLPASPELTEIGNFNFYRACGELPAGHWKKFRARLNEELTDGIAREKAIVAAKLVFDHLSDQMSKV